MKTSTILKLAAVFAAIYYLSRKKTSSSTEKRPGVISRLVIDLTEEAKKPLDEVADEIPGTMSSAQG